MNLPKKKIRKALVSPAFKVVLTIVLGLFGIHVGTDVYDSFVPLGTPGGYYVLAGTSHPGEPG
jgi:hypothetical protein